MDNKKNGNQDRIDISHLKIINGVKFTNREIDIISCMLRGQRAKVIASCLSISSRTVDTHICNILTKLNCTSREGILDFIEKSGKFSLLQKHYHNLLMGESNETHGLIKSTISEIQKSKKFFDSLSLFFKNKKSWAVLSVPMVIFFFSIWAFSSKEPNGSESIRFDLRIPTEAVFLRRSSLIKNINEKLKGKEDIETVALVGVVGIGGVGKTTLAREFGHSYRGPVVWEINAETKNSLTTSFLDLAGSLAQTPDKKTDLEFIKAIQNSEEKEKQLLILVQRWLREKPNWLLIYDNVPTVSEIKNYLADDPKIWGKGKVIITTRDSNIKNANCIKPENVIQLEELSEEERLTLFSKILYNCEPHKLTKTQKEEAIIFLKNIPSFPLDVSITAYYIKNSQITFDQYLERMRSFNKNFEEVQELFLKEMTDYTKTRYEITTLSFKKLIEVNPYFKELLLFICLLDSQNIPKNLLEFYKDKETVDAFLYHLRQYSFITKESPYLEDSKTLTTFSMHRSTQSIGLAFLINLLSKKEKEEFLINIIDSLQEFHSIYLKKSYPISISLLPHLECYLQKVEDIKVSKKISSIYNAKLLLMLGNTQYQCIGNVGSAKKYFTQIYENKNFRSHLSRFDLATLSKNLGTVSVDLNAPEEAIEYCKESLKLCDNKIPDFEVLKITNFIILSFAYNTKNDFNNSKKSLDAALELLSKLDHPLKLELESMVYGVIAFSRAAGFMGKYKKGEAEEYAKKSLNVLNASHLALEKTKNVDSKLACQIIRNALWFGRSYNAIGNYEEALELGFNEAQHIIDRLSINDCPHEFLLPYNSSVLKAYILCGKGEAFLRKGLLKEAEDFLTQAALIEDKYLGGTFRNLVIRPLRAETRIRLKNFEGAYEDCNMMFNTKLKAGSSYYKALKLTSFYHGAIIKYKQNDLKKSAEHFADFFKQMKDFCKGFLEEKEYKDLESKGAFASVDLSKTSSKNDIRQYLNRSTQIFSAIYGPDHPFVSDYVMKN